MVYQKYVLKDVAGNHSGPRNHFLIDVCLLSVIVVNISNVCLLLKNHWANFNETCNKASLGLGNSSLFNRRATFFFREDDSEILKIHGKIYKLSYS